MKFKVLLSCIFFLIITLSLWAQMEVVNVIRSGISEPSGLHIVGGNLFFSEYNEDGNIAKISLVAQDQTPAVLDTNILYPYDLAVYGRAVIIMDVVEGSIWMKDTTGFIPRQRLVSGLELPLAPTVRNNELYFTHYRWSDQTSQIMMIDLDNPDELVIVAEGFPYLTDIEFVNDNELYFGSSAGELYRLDITNPEPLIEFVAETDGLIHLHYHEAGERLYISESDSGQITYVDLGVSEPTKEVLLTDLQIPKGLFVYENELYFCQQDPEVISKVTLEIINSAEQVSNDASPRVYPMPVSNQFFLQHISPATPFRIVNQLGQTIQAGLANPNEGIPTDTFGVGTYWIQIENGDTLPLIKQ